MKKIISCIVITFLVISMFSVSAFAANTNNAQKLSDYITSYGTYNTSSQKMIKKTNYVSGATGTSGVVKISSSNLKFIDTVELTGSGTTATYFNLNPSSPSSSILCTIVYSSSSIGFESYIYINPTNFIKTYTYTFTIKSKVNLTNSNVQSLSLSCLRAAFAGWNSLVYSKCAFEMSDLAKTTSGSTTHTHAYNTAWSKDSSYHWHQCSGCSSVINYEKHDYDNCNDTTCNTCGYVRTPSHSYSTSWSYDSTQHWRECTGCGDHTDTASHSYTDAYDTTCNVCGYTRTLNVNVETEPNNSKATANEIILGKEYRGEIGSYTKYQNDDVDKDFYKIYLTAGNKYRVNIGNYMNEFASTTLIIKLYDPYGKDTSISYYMKKNGDDYFDFDATVSGTYYIQLYNYFDYKNKKEHYYYLSVMKPYPDVTDKYAWYYDPITYVSTSGIFSGYSNGYFGVSDNIQRQDFMVVLARYSGENYNSYSGSSFKDVKSGTYYSSAVQWGSNKGIVTGYQDGRFGVSDNITREQLILFFYRYAKYKGYDTTTTTNASYWQSKYSDFSSVSSWAKEAVIWGLEKGIISGKQGKYIDPVGNAQRCEVAKMFYNIKQNNIFD